MDKWLKVGLIAVGVVVAAAALLMAGMWIGRYAWGAVGFWPSGMMASYAPASAWAAQSVADEPLPPGPRPFGFGYGMGPGMMVPGRPGPDMTGPGMVGPGRQGGYRLGGYSAPEPLSIAKAGEAVEAYLARLGNADLALDEIMIFDNHAYAEIVEKSSGVGAMELLVDPLSLAVYPEHGPNMMWNLKYGMMSGYGMGPGMMAGYGWGTADPQDVSADMPVSPQQAVEAARGYLERYFPGLQVDEHAEPFYGYYTLHTLRDGQVSGMLSVNGFTRQVFPHTWHGDFVEMGEVN